MSMYPHTIYGFYSFVQASKQASISFIQNSQKSIRKMSLQYLPQ